jgi:serine/threonine-protein kinase
MGIRLAHRGSDLWANGVRFKDVFGPEARARIDRVRAAGGVSASRGALEPSIEELALKLAPREVLAGPFGDTVRHAADDRRVAMDAMVRMPKADRDLIPDVGPTVDALAERVGALAQALHRLDEDVRPGAVEQLDQRIAALRAESADTPDHERRLALLERQRSTVADLAQRREALAAQIESAALMLQNVRLDLVALRSAGVQASIDSSSSATQEARALSRELGYVLDAAKKIRE